MNPYLFLWSVLLILVVVVAIVKAIRSKLPKWKEVYFCIQNHQHTTNYLDAPYWGAELKLKLIERFDLTPQQADDCLLNKDDQDWFKENIK